MLSTAALAGCDVATGRIDRASCIVAVVMPNPVGEVVPRARFVAAMWGEVQIHIRPNDQFVDATIRGVGVEVVAASVL
jgi:hypothetical protein